jgi:hypothetical protein
MIIKEKLHVTLKLRRLAHVPAKWDPVRRQGHAPTRESTAFPGDIGSLGDPISPGNAVAAGNNQARLKDKSSAQQSFGRAFQALFAIQ